MFFILIGYILIHCQNTNHLPLRILLLRLLINNSLPDSLNTSSSFDITPGFKPFAIQAWVVQKVDNAIHRINHYPLDNSIGFASVYPVDSAIHRLNNQGLECCFLFDNVAPFV